MTEAELRQFAKGKPKYETLLEFCDLNAYVPEVTIDGKLYGVYHRCTKEPHSDEYLRDYCNAFCLERD